MAGTTFSEVFDKFMVLVDDYRLVTLFQTSQTDFETYLQGWLDNAILEFYNCDQSLSYSSTTFGATLTTKNQLILARIMVKYWLMKEVQDVTEMRLHIQDGDFKTYSEAQNLQAKSAHLDKVKEDVSQLLVDYSLNTNDWSSWYNDVFYTP
jgi:hypothetical protein